MLFLRNMIRYDVANDMRKRNFNEQKIDNFSKQWIIFFIYLGSFINCLTLVTSEFGSLNSEAFNAIFSVVTQLFKSSYSLLLIIQNRYLICVCLDLSKRCNTSKSCVNYYPKTYKLVKNQLNSIQMRFEKNIRKVYQNLLYVSKIIFSIIKNAHVH